MATLLERANEKLRERKKLITDARAILDKETLTAEDRTEHSRLMTRAMELGTEADSLTTQHNAEASLGTVPEPAAPPPPSDSRTDQPVEIRTSYGGALGIPRGERIYRAEPGTPMHRRSTPEYQRAFRRYLAVTQQNEAMPAEDQRALAAGSDEAGGYTIAPQQFVAQLLQAVDNATFVRQLATVFQVPNAQSLGAPSLDADPADPTWTTELAVGDEDSTMDFGKRELSPHPLAQYIKVSKKLVRASALNIDAVVRARLGYKVGVVQESAFLTGTGANQPLGVFTASDMGVSTGRDVSTGNTTTSIQTDGLLGAKYGLKGQYHPNARWIFHRDGVLQIAKLKDGNGQYLWRESVRAGEPDRLLGFPVLMSEYAPNTFTTALYVGILGDFSYYWIADALDMTVQVLVELYAATNQNGYISRMETDGMPVLAEAFSRVKLA
jgi:HK97 family phage major capsid protein